MKFEKETYQGDAIGLTITAHTVVLNGTAHNVRIEKADCVVFNDESKNTIVEDSRQVIFNHKVNEDTIVCAKDVTYNRPPVANTWQYIFGCYKSYCIANRNLFKDDITLEEWLEEYCDAPTDRI